MSNAALNLRFFLGIALVFASLASLPLALTGRIVTNTAFLQNSPWIRALVPLALFVAGVFLLTSSRAKKTESLDDVLRRELSSTRHAVEVRISRQALERAAKDARIRDKQNWAKYVNQIILLAQNPEARPSERIGEFNVSPRGNTSERVAWYAEREGNRKVVYICDFLYHIKNGDYCDRWNRKAAAGKITRADYSGFQTFSA